MPIVYPLLAYLLARMFWIGFRARGRGPPPLQLIVPVGALGVALVFLLGFRVGLNVTDSNVIDVGYAGVIGADSSTTATRCTATSRRTTSTATPTGR